MQTTASDPTPSLRENAAALRSYLDRKSADVVDHRDPLAGAVVKGLSAGDMITLVEAIGYPAGSLFNVILYKLWLELCTGTAAGAFAIWYNLGIQYGLQGDGANRDTAYRNALALKPDLYQATINLGLAREAAGETALALSLWRDALQPDAARIALLNHSGRVLENRKQLDEAARSFTTSLLTDPEQADVLHHWIGLRTRMCAWPVYDTVLPGVTRDAMDAATRALTMLALCDSVERQDRGNASWIAEKMPPAPARLCPEEGYAHRKLRVGYLSSDFCMHPIAYLVAELFELHDRDDFEIYGYCSTKEDGSEVRQRILRSFDAYVDIRTMSDEAVARAIRHDEIDILVDLNGLTLGTRLQALRWRPAPLQITYLGYNGPIPLPELDYIIADEFVIPPEQAALHRPKPLMMPRCYQVNDSTLPIATTQTRGEAGLPPDAFVFCCFSNTYKITEGVFDGWMEILRRAEGSVLWLFVDNPYAQDNLKARAAHGGLAPERLIFAGRVEAAQYRGRLALADLFLDTYPYNAGTTASDALRVGLPLITLSGESFTARMAGSLLTAMNLTDGIVHDLRSYIDLAVALATDRKRYAAFKARVTPEAWLKTLGDTSRFCKDLEGVFQRLARRPDAADRARGTAATALEVLESA